MKNILYINTTPFGGGAAAVMQRLGSMMRQRGDQIQVLTRVVESNSAGNALTTSSVGGLLSWCLWRGQQDYYIQKSHQLRNHPHFRKADILHLHNLHGDYFNLWSLPLLSALKPTVWTLHDMQALTGHCAHSLDCDRWQLETGCGHCPYLKAYPRLWRDTTHQLWKNKQTIYTHSSLYLVTPSVWLQRLVEKSLLREQPLVCIPNGADTNIYRLQDKDNARRLLGFPLNVPLIGGCADDGMANPWKGGKYTLNTILELKKSFPDLHFLNIGIKTAPTELQHIDWVHHIPYVNEPAHLALLYAALDFLLYPTLADNHPLVCIESLCCGTPIVGFATGGVPEIVRDGLDGLLVPPHDGISLTKAAVTLLQNKMLQKHMSQEAAVNSKKCFNLELFAQRYENLYNEVHRMPRSLAKSRLPLDEVPNIVKSKAFIRQEYVKYPHPSLHYFLNILQHSLKGAFFVFLATLVGIPLQIIRTLRSIYFRHIKNHLL